MAGLSRPATRGGHANVLQHLQGYVKDELDAATRQELAELIHSYRRGEIAVAGADDAAAPSPAARGRQLRARTDLSRAPPAGGRSAARTVTRATRAQRRTLVWMRNDLRVADNPALAAAAERGSVVAVYLSAPAQWSSHGVGANRRAFLLRTLVELSKALDALNIPLLVRSVGRFAAQPAAIVRLAKACGADAVMCNDEYPLDERRRDDAARDRCARRGNRVPAFQRRRRAGARAGTHRRRQTVYGVYAVQTALADASSTMAAAADRSAGAANEDRRARRSAAAAVGGAAADRSGGTVAGRRSGSDAPARRVRLRGLARYHSDRDRPDRDGTSRLSPYLAVGAVSARQCIAAARARNGGQLGSGDRRRDHVDQRTDLARVLRARHRGVSRHQPRPGIPSCERPRALA